jgi:DNA-binding IclR family transcriptional regulator
VSTVPKRSAAPPRRSAAAARAPSATGRRIAPGAGASAVATAEGPAAAGAVRLVPAVERAALLLDALAASRQPQSLADLARALSLPRSSVHGLLATLVALGLARRNGDAEFSLGPKPLQWADAYAARSDVLRAFDAHVDRVPALGTETVMLATLEGADVIYLACRQGSRALAVNFRVGGRFPAACTSSGKAMLATLPDAVVRERLGPGPLPRLTRHGVGTVPALLRQLDGFRHQGWAVDDEETAEGMQCFGAAIHDARGPDARAAVAVSVIKAGLTARRRTELVDAIRSLAGRLSAELGGTAATAATAVPRG